jgi:hypothetical protein
MPATLLAYLLLASQAPAVQKVELVPTDDLWIYPHASDAAHDANLRIWGAEGKAAPADPSEAENLSMAYLKWDVKDLPTGKKLTKATLVVTNIPNPGYTPDQAKAAPLQARPLGTEFDEKTWEYEKLGKLLPPKEAKDVFGVGTPGPIDKDKPVTIEVDLLKGPNDFRKYLDAAVTSGKPLGLALTSALDMVSLGRTAVYKIYSRDDRDVTVRPKLVLVFE